jgi:hypothetical protein
MATLSPENTLSSLLIPRLFVHIKNGTYSLYPSSLNSSVIGDSCEPWTAGHPNISDKIVLIRYGGCRGSEQQANAVKAGA